VSHFITYLGTQSNQKTILKFLYQTDCFKKGWINPVEGLSLVLPYRFSDLELTSIQLV